VADPRALAATIDRPTVVAEGAPLDLHEEIAGKASQKHCGRWPKRLSLISNFGEIVQGRCRSPNLCDYCSRLAAVENAELLSLDAMHGVAPTTFLVLTQPSADREPRSYYESRNQLQRVLRSQLPGYEAAWLVEFTTGRAETSGGLRRPHFNALLKGVRTDDQATMVRQAVEDVWCRRQGAAVAAQYVAPVQEIGGLARYLALHFAKPAQAPPAGWRGHRFRATRGYLWLPTPQARKLARESLINKRELWRALSAGVDAEQAERQVAWAAWVRDQTSWGIGPTPNFDRARHRA
jgi:hypothetical protein